MRKIFGIAATTALVMGSLASGAEALPIASAAALSGPPAITLVADGCGPYGHRSHFGYCKPNFGDDGRPAFYGPPRIYGGEGYYRRRCFVRETYDGPRRFCR